MGARDRSGRRGAGGTHTVTQHGAQLGSHATQKGGSADPFAHRFPTCLQLKYADYLNKRHLVNPRRSGPFHFRAPSRIFYKAVRGMVPHKVSSRLSL